MRPIPPSWLSKLPGVGTAMAVRYVPVSPPGSIEHFLACDPQMSVVKTSGSQNKMKGSYCRKESVGGDRNEPEGGAIDKTQ